MLILLFFILLVEKHEKPIEVSVPKSTDWKKKICKFFCDAIKFAFYCRQMGIGPLIRNRNQSLVQDLVLNPGIKQQQHYKKHKRKQETTINNNRFFMVILKRPYYTCTNIALLSRLL